MDTTTFVRKPFLVEAVEITAENIAEIAELVGELKEKPDGTPYIQANRKLVPNSFMVYPGFYMTKMDDNIRCYSRRVFNEQFVQTNPEIEEWVNSLTETEDKETVSASDSAA